ncbi:MAG: thermonuclease family protein [Prevotellaceae bacterium]|jgi:endonuclease YncB( thermonuclease family)|nr:thermonuclease family protein [Prevotellaceae bacterium]
MKNCINILLCWIFTISTIYAQSVITGKVVKIADGDTFTMLVEQNQQVKIRLNSIDCPESKQDFGQQAKQYLSKLVFGKVVSVSYKNKDRYGRVLGTVYIDNVNVNEEMIKAGMAWHYKQYDKSTKLADMETTARQNRIGLWSHSDPIAPWNFRKKKK